MIRQFTSIEVIATMIAEEMLSRTIRSVQKGCAKNPVLPAQLSVYRAIQDQYPETTISIKQLYDSMLDRAELRDNAEWEGLNKSIPEMLSLLISAPADFDAWKEMPVFLQWSIISSVERSLADKEVFYRKKGDAHFLSLADQCHAAQAPFYKLVTKYLQDKTVATELEFVSELGINVQRHHNEV